MSVEMNWQVPGLAAFLSGRGIMTLMSRKSVQAGALGGTYPEQVLLAEYEVRELQ